LGDVSIQSIVSITDDASIEIAADFEIGAFKVEKLFERSQSLLKFDRGPTMDDILFTFPIVI
jgi:hypothetical protein